VPRGWRARDSAAAAVAALTAFALLLVAAFILSAVTVAPRVSEVLGALGFVALVATGVLYAWRPPRRLRG
jgi:peptidoglycan/LPS O-acetylase OafA/YrhL